MDITPDGDRNARTEWAYAQAVRQAEAPQQPSWPKPLDASALFRVVRPRLRPWRGGLRDLPGIMLRPAVELRWTQRTQGRRHRLHKLLLVSLTSFPPRFQTLALSLKCLLTQSLAPDRVVLWIAKDDFASLPRNVLDLRKAGLEILGTDDIGSYKKIIPALRRFPDAHIVTADDDVYYSSTWLSDLVAGFQYHCKEIPAGRVHRIVIDACGAPAPYTKWDLEIKAAHASPFNLATGVAGVLYPPGCLHPDVTDAKLFSRLCPGSDDLWLYFMARRAGWAVRKVGAQHLYPSWPGSQRTALQHVNFDGGNDRQLAQLIEYFGSPFEGPAPSAPRSDAVSG